MSFLVWAMAIAVPGWVVAHRVLGERSRLVVAALGFPLGLVGLLTGTNLGLRLGLGLAPSVAGTLVLLGLGSLLAWRRRAAPELVADKLNGLTWLFLIGAVGLVTLYCNQGQIKSLDDDFWIHTPIQTELLKGGYPPRNPFFPELPLNGHFGRDLLIVCFTYLTGATTFWAQMAFTTLANISVLLLFFATFWRFTGSRAEASVATAFLFFGVNMAHRVGCFDAFTNNNTTAHLWMALMLFLSLKLWEEPTPLIMVVGSVVLGSYGIVYETHFGLAVLATSFTAITLVCRGRLATVGWTVAMLLLALPQATTQGGVLTDLSRRTLGLAQAPAEKGLLNQSQSAELHFPKRALFCIREGSNEFQPVSTIYQHWPASSVVGWFYRSIDNRPYNYSGILSRQVLKMHWLPLFLAPFSFVALLWAGHRPGLWLWYFGMSAFVVPGVVDFGPIHECEYFRWEFAAAMALSGALGLAGVWLVRRLAGDPDLRMDFQPGEGTGRAPWLEGRWHLSVKGRLLLWSPLVALIWLSTLAWVPTTLTFLQTPWTVAEAVFLKVDIRNWLHVQGTRFGFDDADYQAAEWLGPQVGPGRQRLLLDFPHQSADLIGLESILMGMTGAYSIGHMLPLDTDPIGTTPFRMNELAGQFWELPTAQGLKALNPDWVFLRLPRDFAPTFQVAFEALPGVQRVYDRTDGLGRRRAIYEIQRR